MGELLFCFKHSSRREETDGLSYLFTLRPRLINDTDLSLFLICRLIRENDHYEIIHECDLLEIRSVIQAFV
jgi:hypothetical protein